ncbi:16S rRNA (uracil(1498)-N(3))-methyltransferase [Iodobacter fluviatilis]|uniref:Ribosomal RNA small subunit methyltransferase E n=1 Tax=Iodobacter fluviatilis TaxID=537 RepID=A0A377SWQ1_9NEIS|nr:16S rRNA (uracil(1498)-N(3))-methyltransferase [Iodobacter fluviatilis]TCU82955.1 16S rRNA (uracil1498-N3)-methyltransferase [Iodobacter fluviatilis]STR45778.1 Ribosomal RNA small subunit methyltransferase E [Iodobacter fluviatilis]
MPRFFLDMPLATGLGFNLPESVARHVQVLRLQPDDNIILFNGQGGEYAARVTEMGKRHVSVEVLAWDEQDRESPLKLTLLQAISASDRMDYTIQKASELGVSQIQPIISEYCQQRLSGERAEKRLAHWQAIAVSAAEQCGRTRVPTILPILKFEQALAQNAELKLLLSPIGAIRQEQLPATAASATVLIGPEGGFSTQEESLAIAAGYTPLMLGPRIFRTETVAPVIAALLQSKYGDL